MNELVYWLVLQENKLLVPHYLIDKIISECGTLQRFWSLTQNEMFDIGLTLKQTEIFNNYVNNINYDKYLSLEKDIISDDVEVLKYSDDKYPIKLKKFSEYGIDPPFILFLKGDIFNIENCIGIVGTRNASYYARKKAREFSRELAQGGNTIISGLARGIDYEAHSGALDTDNGITIAVLAWMNPIYPSEHQELSREILRRGCLISENYKGNGSRGTFVERNRIISGLSKYIIAVESGPTGGTVRQVDYAVSQKRLVYTLYPSSNVSSEKIDGFNTLISKGARAIKTITDISKIETYLNN